LCKSVIPRQLRLQKWQECDSKADILAVGRRRIR
jgi:hypothetical protein